jgi:ribonuclease E
VRDTESSALQILRIIQEEAQKDNTASVLCQVPVEVASFLLNEKRTEIAKIELKQRINVLMVPNKSFETPNYKLERLKHDDPRLDNIQASYKLAEEVEDPTAVTRRSQEPTNKQTPVIKGVLPDAPAPVVAPKPVAAPPQPAAKRPAAATAAPAEKGFFGWIKSLFGGGAAAEPAKPGEKKDEPRDARGGRDGQRRSEGRGEGRPEGRGEGRGRGGRGGRGEGRGEGGRGGRGGERQGSRERTDADNRTLAADASAAPQQGAVNGEAKAEPRQERGPRNGEQRNRGERGEPRQDRGGNRGERGERGERQDRGEPRPDRGEGRNERRSRQDETRNDNAEAPLRPEMEANALQQPATVLEAGASEPQATRPEGEGNGQRRSRDRYGRDRRERGAERGERSERPAPQETAAQEGSPVAAPAQAVPETPAPAPVAVAAPAAPAPVPVQAAPAQQRPAAGLPRVQPYVLPLPALNQVAETAGLQWVNSDATKVAAVQAAIAAEPKPVHVPRERPAPVVIDEGPLILVETRRDLRDLPLPDAQAAQQ